MTELHIQYWTNARHISMYNVSLSITHESGKAGHLFDRKPCHGMKNMRSYSYYTSN